MDEILLYKTANEDINLVVANSATTVINSYKINFSSSVAKNAIVKNIF